ncbi:MAG TPA: zinc ribbon domain-containing protein, partial [Blastocatellia bacterium]|nr:zinc ribbon domain-containing protein [Blastocatellia bacterium]
LWFFLILATIAGLARVIGDHVMLGEPITFRRWVTVIRGRVGNIIVMGLLTLVLIFITYVLLVIVLMLLFLLVGLIAGAAATLSLPPWAVGVAGGLAGIVIVAAAIYLVLYVVARFIFMPQVIMLEGQSVGEALGRAIKLGGGNWHRLGAIILFGYFISLSLLAALLMPVGATLYMLGFMTEEFWSSPAWNAIYMGCNQVSNLLVLPIWVVSLTLLYFDSRVRKEAYDLELLAREVSPGFYWQPVVQTAAVGYDWTGPASGEQAFPQSSPLGLTGFSPRPSMPPVEPVTNEPAPHALQESKESFLRNFEAAARGSAPQALEARTCKQCGAPVEAGDIYCTNCGAGV